jgi:peptide-methionine (S)-S-oxide reductase
MGDHSESLWLLYDPQQISYADLLEIFWKQHQPLQPRYSRQYRSAIFTRDAEQAETAGEIKTWLEAERGHTLHTAIERAGEFTPAEGYHQKYYLQRHKDLMTVLLDLYPDREALFRSTLAARLNAVVGGDAGLAEVRQAFDLEGTPSQIRSRIEAALRSSWAL